jgi:hypothetical protein
MTKAKDVQGHIGLWIDHREAVLVTITDKGEETKHLKSNMESHVRFSGSPSDRGSAEDMRDRQFGNRLDKYYDEVVALLRDAESIQVFGPGEAKGELEKRLAHIDLKRAALGLARYDAHRFGMSGDAVMMQWLKAREMGTPVSPYSTEGLHQAA